MDIMFNFQQSILFVLVTLSLKSSNYFFNFIL